MRLPAATWPAGDSALNLAPGQAALSSANRRAPRLGGCNNHLKGQIKAPLREFLCSRPQLMLRGLFKPRRGRCFKYLPPESNPPTTTPGCERAVAEAPMDKGRFSVEWLAQSSCGGARTVHRHLRDAQDRRPRDLGECRPPRRAGTVGVAAAEVTTVGANGRWGNGRRARGRRGSAAARAATACVPAP